MPDHPSTPAPAPAPATPEHVNAHKTVCFLGREIYRTQFQLHNAVRKRQIAEVQEDNLRDSIASLRVRLRREIRHHPNLYRLVHRPHHGSGEGI